MKNFAWIIGFGLMVSLFGCDTEDYGQYQTLIKGDWEGTESIEGQRDSLTLLKFSFDETGKTTLIVCKINPVKVTQHDTISVNAGTYAIEGSKIKAKTNYLTSGSIRESMLQATILLLNQDSMALESTDGLKRNRVSTFKKVN